MTHVAAIWLYPVKGCAGVSVNEADIVAGGLARDRRYMLVDEDGTFITQRTTPSLCLYRTEILPDRIAVHAPQGHNQGTLNLPLELTNAPVLPAEVWDDEVRALEHTEGSAWFSKALGKPVRLVYMPEEHLRPVDVGAKTAHSTEHFDSVSFADAYPILLTNKASLEDLNLRLASPISMTRFRPNVVVTDAMAYEEDEYREIVIGVQPFLAPKLCNRCSVTTVDPLTGERGTEPLRTLSTYRKWGGSVWFGVNLVPRRYGTLRVGDLVRPVPESSEAL